MSRMDLTSNDARVALATKWATKYGLDPLIVAAVCEQESGWEPGAVRFEPAFLRRYIAPLNLDMFESFNRATSWGLCQVMGQVAIELGFRGDLTALRDPDTGLDYGCRKLQKCFAVHGEPETSLLAYNGGGNQLYPKQVLARVSHYEPQTAEGAD
jgi:soluble lytic murein transglycosylase-like protein